MSDRFWMWWLAMRDWFRMWWPVALACVIATFAITIRVVEVIGR